MTTLRTSILAATLLAAGLSAAALPQVAASSQDQAQYEARLEEAFRLADGLAVDERLLARLTAAARKADRLAAASDCTGQAWPYAAACLAGTIRTVTVEYRPGDATSVLVRLPAAAQIASR